MKKSIIILLSLIWGLEICARDFVHPGGVHTINDLERIKEKVLAKESPWIDGWNLMIQDSKAQYTYKAAPAESVSGPSGRRQRAARDGVAAYYNFLRWYVTGDERHAQCAVDILNAWSSSVNDVITGELFQLPANIFVEVAEVVRAYPGWKEEDIERFKKMCKEYFYPACRDFLGECGSWSGWDGPANTCNMAIGIFCDDETIYNEALEYYKSGSGGGCLTQMVNPLTFQVNEMGRDTPHAEIGPGSAAELCQMAWNQGDDLFGLEDNLLLKGFEYLCRFNLTHEYDRWEWDTKEDCANRFFYYPASCWRRASGRSFVISNMPANEIIYNHYVVRKGLEAPWTEAMINARGLTACGWEAPGYVAFTYTLDAGKSPFHSHVLPLAPEQVKAVSGLEEVVVSWMPHEGDVVNGAVVERASSPEGPFTEVGRWDFNTTRQYADTTVQGGHTYYYRVAEVNKAGTGAYSKSVKATPYQGTPLPEGWQLTNFGNRELGDVVYHDVNGHTFAIQGTGTSFGGSSDNVTYVYTPVRKNTTLIVRLFDSVNTDEKSERAGLMMRESLEPGARMASVGLADTGFRYVWFAPRTVAGKNAVWIPGNTHTWLEVWFKLTREGDIFTAYQSLDGQTWYKVGSQAVDMADDYYAGMYVAADISYGYSMQAFFDHLTLTDELHPALPQVKGLKAETLNSSRVSLAWQPVAHADYYVVRRAASIDKEWEIVDGFCQDTVFVDEKLEAETGYIYDVRPVGMSGEGEAATVSVETPVMAVPASPSSLKVWPGGEKAFLSWAETDEASTYVVYRAEGNGTGFERVSETEDTEYVDVGLQVGNTYIYKVSAKNTVGEGECTREVSCLSGEASELRLWETASIIGTPGSWNGEGNTCDKAMDGDIGTFFDSDVSTGAWVGLDLGRNTRAMVSRIGYAPRNSTYAKRLKDGCFQLSEDADFTSPVTLYTIDVTDTESGTITYRDVDARKPYRYVRYLSAGEGSSGNIAEAEFWGFPVELAGQEIEFAEIPVKTLDERSFDLQASASSGLPVVFSSSDADVAQVVGEKVYLKASGTCEIHADQPGNDEYGTAERVSRTLVVSPSAISDAVSAGTLWEVRPLRNAGHWRVVYHGQAKELRATVFDLRGIPVADVHIEKGSVDLSLAAQPRGVYLLKLTDGRSLVVNKLVNY